MVILYNLFISLFAFLAYIAVPFHKKTRKFVFGRHGVLRNLKKTIKKDDKIIWFHAASLGEFEQGRPVMEAIKKNRPDLKILLTFFSPSGYEIRKNYVGADYICYLPYDTSWNASSFVKIVNPVAAYFIKYEFWYSYIDQLHKRNIPIYSISAIFRPDQVFFKWYGRWFRGLLRKFSAFYVQNQQSANLLKSIKIENIYISGDTRFDRVFDIAKAVKQIPVIESFAENIPVLVAGSTWPADESLLVQYINQCKLPCKFIIAPHEIHESGIQRLIDELHLPTIRFSKACEADLQSYNILIIDNIGMLSSIYQYGKMSYIGGGFGKGIHNTLEAATFGLPVIFGPNYYKFKEANDLIAHKGAFSISNFEELRKLIDSLLNDPHLLPTASNVCKKYVADNTGATDIILKGTL